MYKRLTCARCGHHNDVEIKTRKESSSSGDIFSLGFLLHCYTFFIFYFLIQIFKIVFEMLGEIKDLAFSAPIEEKFNCKKCKAKLDY